MARPKYPSDERRAKQRPHAKVHLSIRSHPRYAKVFADPEARGIVVGLWVLAVQYHAAKTGDRVTLGAGDLVWLTGRTQVAHAERALRALCARMQYPVSGDRHCLVVDVRNLKRKQGFDSALRSGDSDTPHPSEEPIPKNQRTDLALRTERSAEGALSRSPEGSEGRRYSTGDARHLAGGIRAEPSPPPSNDPVPEDAEVVAIRDALKRGELKPPPPADRIRLRRQRPA